jgi:two-component system sensor histidine kinase YesM
MKLIESKFFFKDFALFLIPTMISLLIIGVLSFAVTHSFVKQEIRHNNLNMLNQIKENVELMLNELDPLVILFDTDPEVVMKIRSFLTGTKFSIENINFYRIVQSFINAPANARPYIHSIYVYYDNDMGRFLTTREGLVELNSFYDTQWYQDFVNNTGQLMWTKIRQIRQYEFESTKVITIYRRLPLRQGVIVLNILPEYIHMMMSELTIQPNQTVMILNEDDELLFCNHSLISGLRDEIRQKLAGLEGEGTIAIQDKPYVVMQVHSAKYNWRYVSMVPQAFLYRVPIQLSNITLFSLAISFVLALGLTYYVTSKKYLQIARIREIIDSAKNGYFSPAAVPEKKDEYSYIIEEILNNFIEQHYLKMQLSERKYRLKTMELLALQSQINPHFLFNTLHAINCKLLLLTKGPNEISDMLEKLSDILDYSLSHPERMVTLEKEITNARNYVDIQKIRYGQQFEVLWEYDEKLLHKKVVKMILQPLIENSIYHGIRGRQKLGLIKVKAFKRGDFIKISVIDNGVGIPRRKLQEIYEKLNGDWEYSEEIGLLNTHYRLKLIYGDRYRMVIRTKQNLGTAIYLYIPDLEEAGSEEEH